VTYGRLYLPNQTAIYFHGNPQAPFLCLGAPAPIISCLDPWCGNYVLLRDIEGEMRNALCIIRFYFSHDIRYTYAAIGSVWFFFLVTVVDL
jgi:hypothetical protein